MTQIIRIYADFFSLIKVTIPPINKPTATPMKKPVKPVSIENKRSANIASNKTRSPTQMRMFFTVFDILFKIIFPTNPLAIFLMI